MKLDFLLFPVDFLLFHHLTNLWFQVFQDYFFFIQDKIIKVLQVNFANNETKKPKTGLLPANVDFKLNIIFIFCDLRHFIFLVRYLYLYFIGFFLYFLLYRFPTLNLPGQVLLYPGQDYKSSPGCFCEQWNQKTH